jgi:hypothetical protein
MKKIVQNLRFKNNKLVCKGKNGKECPVFKKQGSLDGACATYSVIMNLLILGVISDIDTRICVEHKNKDTKNLFDVFCNDYGMHRNGQSFYKIKRMLKEGFGNVVDVQHTDTKTSSLETLESIIKVIDEGIPVIISVYNSIIVHAMLAVGYEKEEGEVTRVFCLDPSGDYIRGHRRWNATIRVNTKRKNVFAYQSVIEGEKCSQYVDLDDILIIRKL